MPSRADDLLARLTAAMEVPFQGWDFSHLAGRFIEAEPTWRYIELARARVASSHDILDVATGGGEIFSTLAPFPGRARAVEGYLPNLEVARRRLGPLGVEVFQANTRSGYPFDDESFDLVLNRHGGFRTPEVHRVLKPGGAYLTQQVGGDNLSDLTALFGRALPYPANRLDLVAEALIHSGFDLLHQDKWYGPVTFGDVSALVYFLKAVPWVIQDFDLARDIEVLRALDAQVQNGAPLTFTYSRFLIEAVKR